MATKLTLTFKTENGAKFSKKIEMLKGTRITLGRKSADITVDDAQVSRVHCELEHNGNSVVVRDLQSHNGILVNGQKVAEAELKVQDKIQIGHTLVIVEIIEETVQDDVTRSVLAIYDEDKGTDTGLIAIEDKTPVVPKVQPLSPSGSQAKEKLGPEAQAPQKASQDLAKVESKKAMPSGVNESLSENSKVLRNAYPIKSRKDENPKDPLAFSSNEQKENKFEKPNPASASNINSKSKQDTPPAKISISKRTADSVKDSDAINDKKLDLKTELPKAKLEGAKVGSPTLGATSSPASDKSSGEESAKELRPAWLMPLETLTFSVPLYKEFLLGAYREFSVFLKWVRLEGEIRFSLKILLYCFGIILLSAILGSIPLGFQIGFSNLGSFAFARMLDTVVGFGTVALSAFVFNKLAVWLGTNLQTKHVLRLFTYFMLMMLPFLALRSLFAFIPYFSWVASVISLVSIYPGILCVYYFIQLSGANTLRLAVFFVGVVVTSAIVQIPIKVMVNSALSKSIPPPKISLKEKSEQEAEAAIGQFKKKLSKPPKRSISNPFGSNQSFTFDFIISATDGVKRGELSIEVTDRTETTVSLVVIGVLENQPFEFSFKGNISKLENLSEELSKDGFKVEDLLSIILFPIAKEGELGLSSPTQIAALSGTCFDLTQGNSNLKDLGYLQLCETSDLAVPLLIRGSLSKKQIGFSIQFKRKN